MKRAILVITLPFLMAGKCGDNKNGEMPACLQKIIDAGMASSPSSAPVKVEEYSYQGKKVYLFTADCCDQFNMLYDANCQPLCAPSGGFTGKGDGKCPDFDSTARLVKVVWTKNK